jgi:hypothetical protein
LLVFGIHGLDVSSRKMTALHVGLFPIAVEGNLPMDNKLIMSVLAAAAIYLVVAAIFGAGIKTIAKQVPAGRTDPRFAPVVCSLAVACSDSVRFQEDISFETIGIRHDVGGR